MAPAPVPPTKLQTATRSLPAAAASRTAAGPAAPPPSPIERRGARFNHTPSRPEMRVADLAGVATAPAPASSQQPGPSQVMARTGSAPSSYPAPDGDESKKLADLRAARTLPLVQSRPGPGHSTKKTPAPSLSRLPGLSNATAGVKTVAGASRATAHAVAPRANSSETSAPGKARGVDTDSTRMVAAYAKPTSAKPPSSKVAAKKPVAAMSAATETASSKAASLPAVSSKATSCNNTEGEAVRRMLSLFGMGEDLEALMSGSTGTSVANRLLGALSKAVRTLQLTNLVGSGSSKAPTARHSADAEASNTHMETPPTAKRFKTSDLSRTLFLPVEPRGSAAAGTATFDKPQPEAAADPALQMPAISKAMRATIAQAAATAKMQAEGLATMVVTRRLLNPRYKQILGWSTVIEVMFPSPNVRQQIIVDAVMGVSAMTDAEASSWLGDLIPAPKKSPNKKRLRNGEQRVFKNKAKKIRAGQLLGQIFSHVVAQFREVVVGG
eukprot:TRINITY_DN3966_c0_g1_i2.p1 TRINITY_DN3966_c0_g1~~TRINITY_DN3966_c0_g1_i2.p1  ORF type:complete len:498 (-),score=60.35 TRINITY_DN3966_c0_g1_i2:1298-2791(-)